MKVGHSQQPDTVCEYCNWTIYAHIPHECDPSICHKCKGKGEIWLGRNKTSGKWEGYAKCDCDRGRIVFK